MKKRLCVFLCFATIITIWVGCKKEEDEKKLSVDLMVSPFPSKKSTGVSPTIIPYLVFSKKINYEFYDQYSVHTYKIVIDSAYITNSQNVLISSQKRFSFSMDTLRFIAKEDFPANDTYKVRLMYHIEIKGVNTHGFEHYIYDGTPQDFQYESSFSTGDYLYFDPNFVVTAHPANGEVLSYLMSPYFTFSKNIDAIYFNTDLDGKYKVTIDSAGLYTSSEQSIISQLLYSNVKDTLKLILTDLLDASSGYKVKLKYHIEVKGNNSETFTILRKEGIPYYVRFSSNFNTSSLASTIDTSCIEYAYPSPYQYHFLRNETTRGVLKLKTASKSSANSKFLNNAKGSTFKIRFSNLTGQNWENEATYNLDEQKLIFQIPSSNLENQKIYKIEYIMVNGTSETVFLTYHFRTSKFDTFTEKLNSITNMKYLLINISSRIDYPARGFDMQEPFDKAEGKDFIGLIKFEALSDASSSWFHDIDSMLYDGLQTSQFKISWRTNKLIQIPPVNAIAFKREYLSPLLSQDQIANGIAENQSNTLQRIEYQLEYFCYYDFCDIYSQVNSAYNRGVILNEWEKTFLSPTWSGLYFLSYYYFNIKYVCGDIVTTTTKWEMRL